MSGSTLLATEGFVRRTVDEAKLTPTVIEAVPPNTELDTPVTTSDGESLPSTGKWKYSIYTTQESNGVRVVIWAYASYLTPRIYALKRAVEAVQLNILLDAPTTGELVLGTNTLISITKSRTTKIYQGSLNLDLQTHKLKLFVGPNVEESTQFNGSFVIEGFIPAARLLLP